MADQPALDASESPVSATASSTPSGRASSTVAPITDTSAAPQEGAPAPPSEAGAAPEGPATASAASWTVTRILDGDTVAVESSNGTIETVRVVGIDTPERDECGFAEAGEALGRMVLDQPVSLIAGARDDRDRYGRILRYLDVRGVDAGLELIRGGFAIARYDSRDGYGHHPREDAYVAADAGAIHIATITRRSDPVAQ